MSLTMKNTILLAKKQVSRGTDAAPTAALNAILASAINPSPMKADFVDRNLIRASKGSTGKLTAGVHRMFEFTTELAGSGTAGTAPAYGVLLQGAGFSETATVGTDVVYEPVSSGEPYLTLYGYLDGTIWKMLDSKGDLSLELSSKAIPQAKWRYLGEYSDGADVALPTTDDYSAWQKPQTVGKLNTPTFNLWGFDAVMQQCTINLGNSLSYRDLVGGGGPHSPDRAVTGSMQIELPLNAAKNFVKLARENFEGAFQMVHGATPGNIIQIDAPMLQIVGEPTIADQDKVAMLNFQFALNLLSKNDDLVITIK